MKQRDDERHGDEGQAGPAEVHAAHHVRDQLRRQADLMDQAAHAAADGGSLQAALRAVAAELRSCSDVVVDSLTAPVTDQRQITDVVAALLLSQTIHVGSHRWPDLAEQVRDAGRRRDEP